MLTQRLPGINQEFPNATLCVMVLSLPMLSVPRWHLVFSAIPTRIDIRRLGDLWRSKISHAPVKSDRSLPRGMPSHMRCLRSLFSRLLAVNVVV